MELVFDFLLNVEQSGQRSLSEIDNLDKGKESEGVLSWARSLDHYSYFRPLYSHLSCSIQQPFTTNFSNQKGPVSRGL